MNNISIAPMLDWTTKHFRYFMHQISSKVTLYTEMVTADEILHQQYKKISYANSSQVIVQIGGSSPQKIDRAVKICKDFGYKEVNINIGCPSQKVYKGSFGACLMDCPYLVEECINAISKNNITASIKTRIGLNYGYSYNYLYKFINHIVKNTECNKIIVHARNAILGKLTPKQNRNIPPLRYDYVYQLKDDLPNTKIIINGKIDTVKQISLHLKWVDGVMIGREAYNNPFFIYEIEKYFNQKKQMTREEVAYKMLNYINAHPKDIYHITRHMAGLYYKTKYAKMWRTHLMNPNITLKQYEEIIKFMYEKNYVK